MSICNFLTIANDVVSSYDPFAQEKLVQLRSEIDKDLPLIICDSSRTFQILSNLVSNAIKFTNAGGSVRIMATKTDDKVEVKVIDSGKGIPSDYLPHVFDRFWQAKATAHQGTGLGLAIAKGLTEAQGEKIWAQSEPEVGSTFSFTLPIAKITE